MVSSLYRIEPLAEGEIHLWLTFQEDVAALDDNYMQLLSQDEREKAARFRFEKHRCEYIVTRTLVRTVLSGYLDIQPAELRFTTNAYGCPRLAGPEGAREMSFSVAHSDGLIVCACARSMRLGVDTERLRQDGTLLEIADRYFSLDEIAELQRCSPESKAMRLFHYWTLKESYTKAIGTGLSTSLNRFTVSLAQPGAIGLRFDSELNDDPENWCCWLVQPSSTHVVAVCAECGAENRPSLKARRVVPLVSSELLDCQLLAQTYSIKDLDDGAGTR